MMHYYFDYITSLVTKTFEMLTMFIYFCSCYIVHAVQCNYISHCQTVDRLQLPVNQMQKNNEINLYHS